MVREIHLAERLDAVLRGDDVGWEALETTTAGVVDACAEREISGLVHQQLTRYGRLRDWPGDLRAELGRAARAGTAAALVRGREIALVLDALALHGVRPVLLKGVPLAFATYDAPGLRAHADTDILVRREEIDTVKRSLVVLGYVEPPLSDGELLFCQFQMVKQDRLGISHVFDVHWKISTQSVFADLLTYDELADASEPVPALGRHARAAGGVHALLLACIHPVMHHRNSERLIWLYDLHLLIPRLSDIELERFAALAVDRQVSAICLHQLTLTRARFRTAFSDRVLAILSSPPAAEPSATYLRPGRRWHDELLSNVQGLGRLRDRLRLLREVVFPGTRYMLEIYRLGKPGVVLLPALYLHRCLRGAWKVAVGRK